MNQRASSFTRKKAGHENATHAPSSWSPTMLSVSKSLKLHLLCPPFLQLAKTPLFSLCFISNAWSARA
jgi:hypothetical protein